MALHEEQNERNQGNWRSKVAREREDISASVEATLADTSVQDDWDDELEDPSSSLQPGERTTLIPPRLSLQSKMLPVAHQGSFVQSATNVHATPSAKAVEEQKPSSNTGRFKRFAQRLTSSLAVFGSSMQPDLPRTSTSLPEPTEREGRSNPARRPVAAREAPYVPPAYTKKLPSSVVDAVPSAYLPAAPMQTTTGQQRLAGHTTKIRLQTAPVPVLPPPQPSSIMPSAPKKIEPTEREGEVQEPVEVVLRTFPIHEKSNITRTIPAVDISTATTDALSVLPSVIGGIGSAARGGFSGTAFFEAGQCDLMVENRNVTETSVVIAMLTSNPGPVAVHYVTLQPKIGFTVHLTAPTAKKTSFNYVILMGELF